MATMWLFSRNVENVFTYPSEYVGAGCIFFGERLVVAGYQPNKKQPILSGLGGGRKRFETAPDTAFRETVEELFHIPSVPRELVDRLQKKLTIRTILVKEGYVALALEISELPKLLRICKNYGIKSPLYAKMPTTLEDLLFKRLPDPTAEITHLCLLPLIDIRNPDDIFDKYFLSDIRGILHHPDLRVTS